MEKKSYSFKRGLYDAQLGEFPLFQRKKMGIVASSGDDAADDWAQKDKEEYIQGYDSYVPY